MDIVYNMDCMIAMKEMKDNEFDLAIVDPPYGIGVCSLAYTNGVERVGNALAKRKDYRHNEWDFVPDKSYFTELFRVSKKQIVWDGNYFADLLPPSKGFIVWDKRVQNGMENDFADCELAWISQGLGVARIFRFLWNGMLQGDMKNKEDRIHPTQKPVALYKWCLNTYAKPGDKILDTHLGSGSSRIACYDLGFDFTGYEIDKTYFDMQEERFQNHIMQQSLFDEQFKDEQFKQEQIK